MEALTGKLKMIAAKSTRILKKKIFIFAFFGRFAAIS